MSKVIVGMSGGVDSSVAAYLLKQQGYEVEGVSFQLWEARCRSNTAACCAEEAALSAAETAAALGIPHRSVDVRVPFIENVIDPFADAYAKALTPNPCILCNRRVKFPFLLREAERTGAAYIATGHYAQVERSAERVLLKKGRDLKKDQSYVLYVLSRELLARLLLPLGGMLKEEVREKARSLNLPAAERPESQEICFVENDDYPAFLEQLDPVQALPGPIRDRSGLLLGTHQGLYRYTIGQRKGLGISSPDPLYVTALDPAANTLYVGPKDEALVKEFTADDLNWLVSAPAESFRAEVKVRSMMEPKPALVLLTDSGVRVVFDEPQWPPSPGQAAVFYDGDTVICGGTIRMLAQAERFTRSD